MIKVTLAEALLMNIAYVIYIVTNMYFGRCSRAELE
jgi:hypothetical protein